MICWHGTEAEARELGTAIAAHCVCEFGAMGMRRSTCATHDAFLHSQRFLDGLLIARQRRAELLREEYLLPREAG